MKNAGTLPPLPGEDNKPEFTLPPFNPPGGEGNRPTQCMNVGTNGWGTTGTYNFAAAGQQPSSEWSTQEQPPSSTTFSTPSKVSFEPSDEELNKLGCTLEEFRGMDSNGRDEVFELLIDIRAQERAGETMSSLAKAGTEDAKGRTAAEEGRTEDAKGRTAAEEGRTEAEKGRTAAEEGRVVAYGATERWSHTYAETQKKARRLLKSKSAPRPRTTNPIPFASPTDPFTSPFAARSLPAVYPGSGTTHNNNIDRSSARVSLDGAFHETTLNTPTTHSTRAARLKTPPCPEGIDPYHWENNIQHTPPDGVDPHEWAQL